MHTRVSCRAPQQNKCSIHQAQRTHRLAVDAILSPFDGSRRGGRRRVRGAVAIADPPVQVERLDHSGEARVTDTELLSVPGRDRTAVYILDVVDWLAESLVALAVALAHGAFLVDGELDHVPDG
jgi:hypothetical protein